MTKSSDRILLIDDDEDLLFLLEKKIQAAGYQACSCWNGEGWEEMIQTFAPALIFIDITMSENDGAALCNKIKADPQHAHIKVYLMSGHANIEEMVAQNEADGSIRKPIDFVVIQAVIQKEFS